MNARMPAQILAPGEFLKEELEARGWSQAELAEILARPPRLICEIIAGKRAITPETAKGLEAALGTSAEMWLNLEASYQLSRTRFEAATVSRRARLYERFPVKEMLRRGWIRQADDIAALEHNFCEFFEIDSVDEEPVFNHAAKKTNYDSAPLKLQLAWLKRAQQIAETVEAPAFDVNSLEKSIDRLRGGLNEVSTVTKASRLLREAGVRVVVVEYLPNAKIDGACFWISDGKSPVVALSLRLDRIDNFWHTLFHEIDHIMHSEGKEAPIVDLFEAQESEPTDLPDFEQRASRNAANYCIDQEVMEEWISRTPRISSRANIVAFAVSRGVHPGLVLGQLQYRKLVPYSYHRDLLEKIRPLVVESTPTEGYGRTLLSH